LSLAALVHVPVIGCLMLSPVGVTSRTNANIAFTCGYQVVWHRSIAVVWSVGEWETLLQDDP
jgi:hypothetical protein